MPRNSGSTGSTGGGGIWSRNRVIVLPSGQTATERRGRFQVSRPVTGRVTSAEGAALPSEILTPSGQTLFLTRRGSYTARQPRGYQSPVNPRRVRFSPQTGLYYESPSHPEQALRNPGRFRTYIDRQMARNPEWMNERLNRRDRHGHRLSSRLARTEINQPGTNADIIQRQREARNVYEVEVLTTAGVRPVALTSVERSIVALHWNEVKKAVEGRPNELWRFRGVQVGEEKFLLMTDEYDVEEAGLRGDLSFESMYPVMVVFQEAA